jgi:hypothetical protein
MPNKAGPGRRAAPLAEDTDFRVWRAKAMNNMQETAPFGGTPPPVLKRYKPIMKIPT